MMLLNLMRDKVSSLTPSFYLKLFSLEAEAAELEEEQRKLQEFELKRDTGEFALKDFLIKPYLGPYDREQDPEDLKFPVNYYDNDDGFWDEWIDKRHKRFDEEGFLTKRIFLKH